MSLILGISPLDKESTITLIENGEITYALSEERLSRVKQQKGFPELALEQMCKEKGMELSQIDEVAYPFYEWKSEWKLHASCTLKHAVNELFSSDTLEAKAWHTISTIRRNLIRGWGILKKADDALVAGLRKHGLSDKLTRVNHQLSHAAAAYFTSGEQGKALAITLDGYGSGLAGGIYLCEPGKLPELLHPITYPNSMGLFYGRITRALGFQSDRHEGKVLGLAAYGDPAPLIEQFRSRFKNMDHGFHYNTVFHTRFEKRLAKKFSREVVAAAAQQTLEEVVTHFVAQTTQKYGIGSVVMAGGVFANVKLNQRISEIPHVTRIFIHPAMGDMGVGTGAAQIQALKRGELKQYQLKQIYLACSYEDQEIQKALDESTLKAQVSKPDNLEQEVAQLLAKGAVVGRFWGGMEYGPRALGNRSILAPATDPEINQWLNKRLNRTEFMPFAPITPARFTKEMYLNTDKAADTARFMTITFNCTDEMKKMSPAAVHVDGTARPQIVHPEVTPELHKILEHYHELTGIASLINTSFNLHEEPIVGKPEDAIRAFDIGQLDALALGPFLITKAT